MVVPPVIVNYVATEEGFHAHPYRDNGGWSVGYGTWTHWKPQGLTKRQARIKLASTLNVDQCVIARSIGKFKPAGRQWEALLDFVYNVGTGAWMHSTLRQDLIHGNVKDAVKQFGRWVYCDGRVLPGLVSRRQSEVVLFRS